MRDKVGSILTAEEQISDGFILETPLKELSLNVDLKREPQVKLKTAIGSLSKRGMEILKREDPANEHMFRMQSNRYSPQNITGNINLCVSENNICIPMAEKRFREDPQVFIPNYSHIGHYGPAGGYPEIKKRLCEYLKEEYSVDVDPKGMVLLPSGNAAYDLLSHCLFDAGDIILTNTPSYNRTFVTVMERAKCQIGPVNFDMTNPQINVEDFNRVYEERKQKGENVKGIFVINPHNPLGIIFPAEDLRDLSTWAVQRGLWLVVDEFFSQCVYDLTIPYTPFIKIQGSLAVKSACFWSLSKDFGLPGVKLAVLHTNDQQLYSALSQLELMEPVSCLAQNFIANFLSDRVWLRAFKEEKLAKLRSHRRFVTDNLTYLGIPFVPATSGIFLYVDFSQKLSSQTVEAEIELFEALADKGVFLTPGSHNLCPVSGFFRLVFACDKPELEEGIRRLHEFLTGQANIVGDITY